MRRYETRDTRFSARTLLTFAAASLPETLSIVAAAGDAPAEIMLYDEIGYWGVTASDFAQALSQAGDGPLTLRINSPGGDVFDGYAIYNMLRARTAPVSVVIDGLAASAASFIAMAGKTISMGEPSMLMIHNSWGLCVGDRNDMLDTAAIQEKIDGQIAAIYAAKSGKPVTEMAAAMDAETWYTSTTAKEAGLCDVVLAGPASKQDRAAVDLRSQRRGETIGDGSKPGPRAVATSPEWVVGADEALPIDESTAWDGPAAAERMLDAAGFNGESPDPAKAKRGFLVWDHHNPKLKASYKLPFADVVDGGLKAIKSGIDEAASRHPDTDIPADIKTKARAVLDLYESKIKEPEKAQQRARLNRLRLAAADAA